jgi:hypothetical protein
MCPDCGAVLPESGACRDYFYELLALEAQVPGGAGAVPHFLAVASYNLQHPSAFMPSALSGLRRTVADVLAERATVEDALRRARHLSEGATRVVRRPDTVLSNEDQIVLRGWPRKWDMTVLDVCRVRPEQYVDQVHRWAVSVTTTLDGSPTR